MAKFVVVDELHLVVRLRAAAPDQQVRDAVRALADRRVTARLRRVIRDALGPAVPLADCRVTVAR